MSTPTPTVTKTNTPTNTVTKTVTPTVSHTNYVLSIGQFIYDGQIYDKNNLSIYYKGYNFTGKILSNNIILSEPPNATSINRPTTTPTPTTSITPTPSVTITNTSTPISTVTKTCTITPTLTPTKTEASTPTPTSTVTSTTTTSVTPTNTITPTETIKVTQTITPTLTRTATPSYSLTNTITPTKTSTASVTPTITPTNMNLSTVNSMVIVSSSKAIAYTNDTTNIDYTNISWTSVPLDFGVSEIAPRTVTKGFVSPNNIRTFIINTYGDDYATSTDGISWNKKKFTLTSDYTGFYNYFHTTIFAKCYNQLGSNRFMAIGNSVNNGSGLSCYLLSTDLNSWSKVSLPLGSGAYWLTGAYGNNIFILIPANSTTYYTSTDGNVWTARSLPYNSSNLKELKYINNQFIAIFASNTVNNIIISSDGINWTTKPTPTINNLKSFIYFPSRNSVNFAGNTYVFLNADNNGFMYSNDGNLNNFSTSLLPFGNTNKIITTLDEQLIPVATYDPAFVVTANGSFVALSPNLITWTYRSLVAISWTSITS